MAPTETARRRRLRFRFQLCISMMNKGSAPADRRRWRAEKAEDGAGHYVMRRSVFAIIFSSMSAVLSSRTFNCDASTTRTTQCIRTGGHGSTLQEQNARDRDKRQQLTKALRSSCPVTLTVSSAARARFGVENKGIPTRRQTRVCSLSTECSLLCRFGP